MDAQARQVHPALARNLLLEAELLRIVRTFNDEKIDFIVLKGIPLTQRLFGRLDAREMVDNDVIVHRADAPRARDALLTLGYEPLPFYELEAQLRIDFQYSLHRQLPGGGFVHLELHWNAFLPFLYPVPERILWEHVEPFDLRGTTVKVFDKPLTIVHLASHFAQHLFSEPRILRDLAAAWSLWREEMHIGALLALARKTGVIHALDYAFHAARDLGMLETPLPAIGSKRAARLRRLLPASRLHGDRPSHDYARILLGLLLVDPQRIPRWLFHRFFPPIETMAAILQRPVSPALYLHYFTRPFRPLARMLGAKF